MCLSGEGPLKGKEVLLSVIAGSISYGLNTKDSDVDVSFINEDDETFDFKEIV